jgi:hypothetical protein
VLPPLNWVLISTNLYHNTLRKAAQRRDGPEAARKATPSSFLTQNI